jgi:hypothetical protein
MSIYSPGITSFFIVFSKFIKTFSIDDEENPIYHPKDSTYIPDNS